MKLTVSSKTLENAFKNDDMYNQFINDYRKYFDYVLIMSIIDPHFELTLEEYLNKRNSGNS